MGRDPGVRTGSGFVDSRGDQPPYQCAGIERGPVCTENVCPGSAESACPLEIRQPDCSRIYPEDGRNTFRTHAPNYTGDMEVRSRQGNSPVRGVSARRDLDQGISEQAAKLLATHSWRKGTTYAYNSSWRQWCSWCNGRQVDPFRAPVVDRVNYLSERFDKGDSYRTLNSRRSAISAFHVPVDGTKVGQHPLVKRFLTATFNARPSQPRYTVQWDVNVVLAYIKSLGTNDKLPDKFLTLKLAMLLALVSAGRTSELCQGFR